jgi:hypothetical protein
MLLSTRANALGAFWPNEANVSAAIATVSCRTNPWLQEAIAGAIPSFPDCYLQWMAQRQRVEPQARALRRSAGSHRGRELGCLVSLRSDASYHTYCHAKAITITTTAVNRPSCAQKLAKLRPFVMSLWIVMAMTSLSDVISDGGIQAGAHGRKGALI